MQAPAKRSPHFNATYRNIVGRNMLRVFGHPVAMCCDMLGIEYGNSAHSRVQQARAWPNDLNVMQHPQMLHEKWTIFQF